MLIQEDFTPLPSVGRYLIATHLKHSPIHGGIFDPLYASISRITFGFIVPYQILILSSGFL